MIGYNFPDMRALQQSWSRTMTSMVWGQWFMLDTGLQAAQTVLASAATVPPAGATRSRGGAEAASRPQELVKLAVERIGKGLAPPREIYQTPYRNQIDWSRFPDWARPTDPEMFEGSSHEG